LAGFSLVGSPASGDQSASNSNAYVTLNFGIPSFDEVILAPADNSFEFTNVVAAVPEHATWAMMFWASSGWASCRTADPAATRR
jgi:hypothetical protein